MCVQAGTETEINASGEGRGGQAGEQETAQNTMLAEQTWSLGLILRTLRTKPYSHEKPEKIMSLKKYCFQA